MGKSVEFSIGSVELTISFDTVDELKTALGQIEEIKAVLKERLPEASAEVNKTMRKDLEGFFDYHARQLVMLKAPESKAKKVCLMLYAVGAEGATPKEITSVTKVQNPSKNLLHNRNYKKYVRKLSRGKYALTDVGLSFVTDVILPELKKEKK
jgi:intein/homing endonuclease